MIRWRVRVLVHQLRRRLAGGRQQPAADQGVAQRLQVGRVQRLAEPLGQPEQQAVLLIGAELDRMAQVGREQQMGVGGLPGEAHRRASRRPRAV